MRIRAFFAASAVLVASARAEVLVVDGAGGGDYTTLVAAVAAAAEGGTLLVKSGSYDAFQVDGKALNIVADEGATVEVFGESIIENLAQDQAVLLSKVNFTDDHLGFPARAALELIDNAGPLRLYDCTVRGFEGVDTLDCNYAQEGEDALLVSGCGDVSLTSCRVFGGNGGAVPGYTQTGCLYAAGDAGDGLVIEASKVEINRVISNGGDGGDGPYGGEAGEGIELSDSRLVAVHSILRGGDGGDGDDFIGPACEPGAPALAVDATSRVDRLQVTLTPGLGGQWDFFGFCDDGVPIAGAGLVRTMDGPPRSMFTQRVARESETIELEFFGEDGDLVYLFASPRTRFRFRDFLRGVYLLDLPWLQSGVALGQDRVRGFFEWLSAFDSLGQTAGPGIPLSVLRPAPGLRPGRDARLLYLQGIYLDVSGRPILTNLVPLLVVDDGL